jgi:hypothetical protein
LISEFTQAAEYVWLVYMFRFRNKS